jgi:hypothetical protein
MKLLAGAVLVVGVVFAFLLWLDWWLPQFTEAVGR